MSLVRTYVICADNQAYDNLVYRGEGWFVCFDDDDPIEVVIKHTCRRTAKQILKEIGLGPGCSLTKGTTAYRSFGKKMVMATSWFVQRYEGTFVAPRKQDTFEGLAQHPDEALHFEGVFYGVNEWMKRRATH
ncbi:hypothetical protein [Methylobacter sp.]|uniref:hypothetical protein n=1 Tax=Methylobacter sp. TaxID=2051955 RepID=UPI0011F74760|nr:hypothetical protein [Methylobacter sp.]TAK59512.1 MAG: hypothetical protein EPO18_20335 [Methylobacter sp.]